MKSTLSSLIFLLCFAIQALSQTTRHFQWFNVGFGSSLWDSPHREDFQLVYDHYYLIRNKSTLQYGLSFGGEILGYSGFTSLFFGYGKSIMLRNAIFGASLAPALDIGNISGAEGSHYITPGINPTLQAVYHPVFNVGLALEVFGQFNVKQSVVGFRLMLHFNNTNRKLN